MEIVTGDKQDGEQRTPLSFEAFVEELVLRPSFLLRNIFQVFHDMVKGHLGEGVNDYPDDHESIGFYEYDCASLFTEEVDHPFFADRIFANRLMNLVNALKRSAQQNKIYIFDGPPGCGKSTFLNNLLTKFEDHANSEEGYRFEIIWRLNRKALGWGMENTFNPLMKQLAQLLKRNEAKHMEASDDADFFQPLDQDLWDAGENGFSLAGENILEIPCPCHDHPIVMIPKDMRRLFFEELFKDHEFKERLFKEKEYGWVFKDNSCTICSSIFSALLEKQQSLPEIFKMLYVRPYRINRRRGEGVSVFNPGDPPMKQNSLTNPILQKKINRLFGDSNLVKYIYSRYAKTNNGIYALMDIKSKNSNRLIRLHNIISEGVYKVEDLEENVYSLFMAVMNPEDKKEIKDIRSFADRIEYINIPYIMDLRTEVKIYRSVFGKQIEKDFLPRVLHNFARIIISSRLNEKSEALLEWINDPGKYRAYCDNNLQLLKMELYTGFIPTWLSEEDRKSFNAKRRRKVLAESDLEGKKGYSGRDSIKIFNEFYSTHAGEDKLVNMNMLFKFFTKTRKDLGESIPQGFLNSLLHMYDYTTLQEVKESLYYYNEEQISHNVQNYLFALNFETGTRETCQFTGETIEITEDYLKGIEDNLLDGKVDEARRTSFRKETQKEYTSRTLTQEIMVEGLAMVETTLYQSMHDRYVHQLKERVLDPFLKNENFRRAIKDYGEEDFKTYDEKIRDDVSFMIHNLCEKHGYSRQGAKEVCIYVVDNQLAGKFSEA
ncbi:MAG: serine protein kinase PrkA [Deltaproteobacteria bacterium]|nr:serine protein kinase PrkA [Deltaproteobacteria bacterium]